MKTATRLGALLLALMLMLAGCGTDMTQAPDAPVRSDTVLSDGAESDAAASSAYTPTLSVPPSSSTETAEIADAMPAPATEPESSDAEDAALICTVSISCAVLLDRMDELDAEKAELVPTDGVLLGETSAAFEEGESVFDILRRVCRENHIHMEFSSSPVYGSAYIEGIGNLYEFDCGDGSGWMYRVNGEFPNYGCSQYTLSAGDTVEWVYTCDFGADVGGGGER